MNSSYRQLLQLTQGSVLPEHRRAIRDLWRQAYDEARIRQPFEKVNPVAHALETALILASEAGLRRSSIISALLFNPDLLSGLDDARVEKLFGPSTAGIVQGLKKVSGLYDRSAVIDSDNFRNLMLSFARDGRAVLVLIADCVNSMRHLDDYPPEEQARIARQAASLYAPLSHKMGLYALKTELEDLHLKYERPEVYASITQKLAESKDVREAYIARFIEPVRQGIARVLDLPFHIKGRTKSVHSIWNKINGKQLDFEDIYDIFAIRVIIDAPPEREKPACWLAYSVVTDMYRPNPSRTRDWLSIPKSNGYESLHTTVLGPEDKWVEVQIRTERMNEVAEKGLAAHWRYKGVRSAGGLDEMLTRIREVLENSSPEGREGGDHFKMELLSEEIYVFTPKGDLFKLPRNASVLDFAYAIHSNLGNRCVGARVNGRNVPIRYRLRSGDLVEIQTGANQVPKQDWLDCVVTARARGRIRQALKENQLKLVDYGKENLSRRFKNRKLEFDEAYLLRLVRRFRFKTAADFYAAIGEGHLDVNQVVEAYVDLTAQERGPSALGLPGTPASGAVSASEFSFNPEEIPAGKGHDDVLVIGSDLKGIDFRLAKCCHPIYGDEVFGFVSVNGGISVHRTDCPNAPQLRSRYGYRLVRARWAGKGDGTGAGSTYPATVQVIGRDDISIVTNVTSLIAKEPGISLRNISIDSDDGLFRGVITLLVSDSRQVDALLRKLQTVKGIKQAFRG